MDKKIAIHELPLTPYVRGMYVVVDRLTSSGVYETCRMCLDDFISACSSSPLPDPFERGADRMLHVGLNCTPHEGQWLNDDDYDLGEKTRSQVGAYQNYSHCKRKSIIVGEYEFTNPICVGYGDGNNSAPAWLSYLGYNSSDIEKWIGRKIDYYQFQRDFGGWFYPSDEGVRAWLDRSNWLVTDVVSGRVETDWVVPSVSVFEGLIGYTPRSGEDLFEDVKNFLIASKNDYSFDLNVFDYSNISGLGLRPLGSKPNSTLGSYGTLQNVDVQLSNGCRFGLLTSSVGGHSGIVFGGSGYSAHGAQLYLCRRLGSSELGYELYTDIDGDRVLVSSEELTYPVLGEGYLRGVALRYLNREKKQVCLPLSKLQAEVDSIKKKVIYL